MKTEPYSHEPGSANKREFTPAQDGPAFLLSYLLNVLISLTSLYFNLFVHKIIYYLSNLQEKATKHY